jgi:hypothetical protein
MTKHPTRSGKTHKIRIGKITAYLTVNRSADNHILEVFGKADNGIQGHLDMACRLTSIALQHGVEVATIIRHMKGDRTEPCGIAGQPTSIYDAIARTFEVELGIKQ